MDAVTQMQLGEYPVHVRLHRGRREVEGLADLAVREAGGDAREDVAFPWTELVERIRMRGEPRMHMRCLQCRVHLPTTAGAWTCRAAAAVRRGTLSDAQHTPAAALTRSPARLRGGEPVVGNQHRQGAARDVDTDLYSCGSDGVAQRVRERFLDDSVHRRREGRILG